MVTGYITEPVCPAQIRRGLSRGRELRKCERGLRQEIIQTGNHSHKAMRGFASPKKRVKDWGKLHH